MNRFPSKIRSFTTPVHYRLLRCLLALLVVSGSLIQVAGSAEASGAIPAAILDQDSVGWASVRNMSSTAFGNYFAAMKAKGYMVVDLEVDELNGNQRVGAIFQKNTDGRGWASWRNLTSAQFSEKWQHYKNNGYRLIDQEAYILNGNRYYAGVWIQNKEGLAWASWRNLTSAQFSEKFTYYNDNGYIPVDFEAYPMAGSVRYAIVWAKNTENLGWKLWRDMTSDEFSAQFQAYQGTYRMVDVESYVKNGTQMYAGIWVVNTNGRAWAEWRDMTAKQFGDKWLQLRDAGYRLVDYEVYPKGGDYRYAGIWRQNSMRPDWPLRTDVNAALETYVSDNNIPGMSVAIAQDNQLVYLRGFGYADIDDKKIATSRTVFQLASVSKALGGTAAMRLVEKGQLDLNAQTRSYVPAMPVHHTHTVAQTLNNRSGIGHYGDHAVPPSMDYPTASTAAATFWNDALLFAPGSQYKYSTFAYTLAGAAMEGATGKAIGDIHDDELVDPFGLSSMRIADWSKTNPNRATLYNGSNLEIAPDNSTWKVYGGGIESSAYDLVRFGMKLVNGSILSQESLDTMWTPPDGLSDYALGWNTNVEDGFQVVAKNGSWDGASSYIRIYPEKQIVIVVLINRRYSDPHLATAIGRDLGARMLAANKRAPIEVLPVFPIFAVEMPVALEELNVDDLVGLLGQEQGEEGSVGIAGDDLLVQLDPSVIESILVPPEEVGQTEEAAEPTFSNTIFLPVVLK